MLIATCYREQAPPGTEYGCERTEQLLRQWLPRLVPSLTRESKGSINFVLTFLDLHCAWKGLRDELCIVFVCPSSEQIQRQSLA